MKILHLSDLHINPYYNKSNIDKTELVIQRALKNNVDHFIFTGDITHDNDLDSFLLFKELLKKYDLLDSKKTTLTIGNHDIFGGVYSVKDLMNFPERCRQANYESQILNFVNHFEELFIDCTFFSKENIFPFFKVVDDVVLIGINTNDVYSVLKNPFASNGRVFETDYENLKKIFQQPEIENKRKIILAHHHFYKNNFETRSSKSELWNRIEGYTLKLRGKKKLLKLFAKNNVEIVLHGHSHENKEYERMGIKFFNAGGSIDNDNETLTTMNIIELTSENIFYNIIDLKIEDKIPILI